MLKLFAAIGAGTLAILLFWGFLVVTVGPSVQTHPPVEKIGPATTMHDPKVRDVTEQPHTAAAPETQSVATAKPAAQPEPPATPPTPAPAAPSPIAPSPPESSEEPDRSGLAADQADEPTAAVQAEDGRSQRHSAGCTRYKTYDPVTQSYRGYDGVAHPCRP